MALAVKRPRTDDLEGEQRLSKRFEVLQLDHRNGTRHIVKRPPSRFQQDNEAWMDVDATKHKVFIHDIDKELESDDEDHTDHKPHVENGVISTAERPIFLPDIEKHLMKVPKHVLIDDDSKRDMENMQLVLYDTPSSLTIRPGERDNVRRAILEARQRARDNQLLHVPDPLLPTIKDMEDGWARSGKRPHEALARVTNGSVENGVQDGHGMINGEEDIMDMD